MKIKSLTRGFMAGVVLICGCQHERYCTVAQVKNVGATVSTKYRYKLAEYTWHGEQAKFELLKSDMERQYPEVFRDDGIPICVYQDVGINEKSFNPSGVLCLLTLGIIPNVWHYELVDPIRVTFANDLSLSTNTGVFNIGDSVAHITPLAFGCLNVPPESVAGQRYFCKTDFALSTADKHCLIRQAMAYAIAVRLLEFENAGKVDPEKLIPKQPLVDVAQVANPEVCKKLAYRLTSCARESGSDFAYRFSLEIVGEVTNPIRAFWSVQKDFRAAICEDYVESFVGADAASLYVDFPEYEWRDGKIEGRAVVLTIKPTSLSYDPERRKGKLAVKVNANQYEEARKWIRKNIETLARDKNIALTTGEIPPAAKFYLGREELKDGNILEIEFMTE